MPVSRDVAQPNRPTWKSERGPLEFVIPEGDRKTFPKELKMKPTYTDVKIPLNKLVLHPRNVRAGTPDSYSEDQIQRYCQVD